jgi:hypothetical protein
LHPNGTESEKYRNEKRTIALIPIAGVLALIGSTSIAFSDEPGSNRPDQVRLPFSQFEILGPGHQTDEFEVPDGMQLVITDLIIQNRNPGGEPVPDYVFSRFLSDHSRITRLSLGGGKKKTSQ